MPGAGTVRQLLQALECRKYRCGQHFVLDWYAETTRAVLERGRADGIVICPSASARNQNRTGAEQRRDPASGQNLQTAEELLHFNISETRHANKTQYKYGRQKGDTDDNVGHSKSGSTAGVRRYTNVPPAA